MVTGVKYVCFGNVVTFGDLRRNSQTDANCHLIIPSSQEPTGRLPTFTILTYGLDYTERRPMQRLWHGYHCRHFLS